MTIKGRVIRLEQKRAERHPTFFVASEEVAIRATISRFLVTDDPSDDPPVPCALTFEEIMAELDGLPEGGQNASA